MPVLINPPAGELGRVSAVLSARGRRHEVREFPGPLSVKAVIEGQVGWRTEEGEVRVDQTSFLVLNDGQPYSIHLSAMKPAETCCLFFERGFVESVYGSLVSRDPEAPPRRFLTRVERRDRRLMPHLRAIHRALAGAGPGWLEEALLEAARELVLIEEEIRRRVARVPAARVATRAETYRRLERGREFLHARVDAPMELAEMARAACLSRFHFHRAFRHAFGLTPHQYRTRLRLERAGALLSRGRPVTEVCLEVGFESLGSFSALFRRSFGVPPSEFARSKKRVAASADTLAANEC